jgi:hypothetical protein
VQRVGLATGEQGIKPFLQSGRQDQFGIDRSQSEGAPAWEWPMRDGVAGCQPERGQPPEGRQAGGIEPLGVDADGDDLGGPEDAAAIAVLQHREVGAGLLQAHLLVGLQLLLDDEPDDPGGQGIGKKDRGGGEEAEARSGAHQSLQGGWARVSVAKARTLPRIKRGIRSLRGLQSGREPLTGFNVPPM